MLHNNSGMTLVVIAAIIAVVAIAALSVAIGISNSSNAAVMHVQEAQALSAAEAGVHYAVNNYIRNDYIDSTEDRTFSDSAPQGVSFSVSTNQAEDLFVSSSSPTLNGNTITNIDIANINSNPPTTLRITGMTIEWDQAISGNLQQVEMPTGTIQATSVVSGTRFDFLHPSDLRGKDTITSSFAFGGAIPNNVIISATFFLSDTSSRRVRLYAPAAGNIGKNELFIVSTGTSTRGRFTIQRTIEATFNTIDYAFTSWNESL